MKVDVEDNVQCRYYEVVLDDEAMRRHHDLLMDFLDRGVRSPRGGFSGPNLENGRIVPGQFRIGHFLAETVCDEYERGMGITPAPAPGS